MAKEKKGEGESEESQREAAQFMPLSPRSADSSLGGTQTLGPCPALYSPGNCSQINLAGYPVEVSLLQCSVAPRALHAGCSFRRKAAWWRTDPSMRHRCSKEEAKEKFLIQPLCSAAVCFNKSFIIAF